SPRPVAGRSPDPTWDHAARRRGEPRGPRTGTSIRAPRPSSPSTPRAFDPSRRETMDSSESSRGERTLWATEASLEEVRRSGCPAMGEGWVVERERGCPKVQLAWVAFGTIQSLAFETSWSVGRIDHQSK